MFLYCKSHQMLLKITLYRCRMFTFYCSLTTRTTTTITNTKRLYLVKRCTRTCYCSTDLTHSKKIHCKSVCVSVKKVSSDVPQKTMIVNLLMSKVHVFADNLQVIHHVYYYQSSSSQLHLLSTDYRTGIHD